MGSVYIGSSTLRFYLGSMCNGRCFQYVFILFFKAMIKKEQPNNYLDNIPKFSSLYTFPTSRITAHNIFNMFFKLIILNVLFKRPSLSICVQ